MATLFRIVLWMVWVIGIGWLWREGMLGAVGALAALAAGSVLAAWRVGPARRKRGELRYVGMSPPPVFAHFVSLRQPPARGQHQRPG